MVGAQDLQSRIPPGGKAGLLTRKHDHYHANERNQTTRKGASPQPPRGVEVTMGRLAQGKGWLSWGVPLGPVGFDFCQHGPTTRPSVEWTAEKAFMLSDRVKLSSAEARVKKIKSGSVEVFELSHETSIRHFWTFLQLSRGSFMF